MLQEALSRSIARCSFKSHAVFRTFDEPIGQKQTSRKAYYSDTGYQITIAPNTKGILNNNQKGTRMLKDGED